MKNDKETLLNAVSKNGWTLEFASPALQNDLELLNKLKEYHISNNIKDFEDKYQNWYHERMSVLNIMSEQIELEKSIPKNNTKIIKPKKF